MVTFHGETRARPLRAVPHERQELDDPPDGPGRGPGPGAAAGADRADARHAPATCRPATTGRTRSSGTACGRSATPRAAGCGWPAGGPTTSPPRYPELRELGRALGTHEAVLDGEVVAFDEQRPAELPAPAAAHAPHLRGARAPAERVGPRGLRHLRPAVPRRPQPAGRDLRGAPRAAARARPQRPGLADPGPPRRRRRGAAGRLARPGPRGDRGQAARLPVHARAALQRLGQGQERPPRRRRGRRLGARARAGARAGSARSPSAGTTTTASCTTAAGWAAGSPRPSSSASAGCSSRWRATRARSPPAPTPPKEVHFVEPELVAAADYGDITDAGTLRHPRYKGLRDDLDPRGRGLPGRGLRAAPYSMTIEPRKLADRRRLSHRPRRDAHVALLAARPRSAPIRTIHAALDAGVNLIDTADAYSADDRDIGHNEELIARALEGRRDGVHRRHQGRPHAHARRGLGGRRLARSTCARPARRR